MIDLHCHLLPQIDDGAASLDVALAMAQRHVEQGVRCVACTPHILPGLYHNTGADIRRRVDQLAEALAHNDIALKVVSGADNHIVPTFVADLKRGHLLALAGSRYVLVEPPHHVVPERIDELFFNILAAGYVPILTHPERLTWIEGKYDLMCLLHDRGVWMQVTSGSLLGRFGRRAKYWAERMVSEGRCELLASDAHDTDRRPPDLARGRRAAEALVGAALAEEMVVRVPQAILEDQDPHIAIAELRSQTAAGRSTCASRGGVGDEKIADRRDSNTWLGRLRRLIS